MATIIYLKGDATQPGQDGFPGKVYVQEHGELAPVSVATVQ